MHKDIIILINENAFEIVISNMPALFAHILFFRQDNGDKHANKSRHGVPFTNKVLH